MSLQLRSKLRDKITVISDEVLAEARRARHSLAQAGATSVSNNAKIKAAENAENACHLSAYEAEVVRVLRLRRVYCVEIHGALRRQIFHQPRGNFCASSLRESGGVARVRFFPLVSPVRHEAASVAGNERRKRC